MIVSITEVRRALGKESKNYTNSEVEGAISIATVLSDLFIDFFIQRERQKKGGDNFGTDENYIEQLLNESGEKNDKQKDQERIKKKEKGVRKSKRRPGRQRLINL